MRSKQKTVYGKVHSFPTKHQEGFTQSEIDELLKQFGSVNMDKFNDAMMGNTGMFIGGDAVVFRSDVLTALRCGLENRGILPHEFD